MPLCLASPAAREVGDIFQKGLHLVGCVTSTDGQPEAFGRQVRQHGPGVAHVAGVDLDGLAGREDPAIDLDPVGRLPGAGAVRPLDRVEPLDGQQGVQMFEGAGPVQVENAAVEMGDFPIR